MRFVHFVTVFSKNDGIGGIISGLHTNAKSLGHESVVIAGKLVGLTPNENIIEDPFFLSWHSFLQDGKENQTFYIYHYGVFDHRIDSIFENEINFNRIFYYHNITPAKFYRGWDSNVHFVVKHSRTVLKNLLKGRWIVTGDSWFNIDEIKVLNYPYHSFYPPVLASSANQSYQSCRTNQSQFSFPTLLFTGRLAPNKRQDLSLFLIKYLEFKGITAQMIFVGRRESIYGVYLKFLTRILGITKRVHYRSDISQSDLHHFYKYADFFVITSEHEGFCVPVIESLDNSCMPLARPFGAVKELLNNSPSLCNDESPITFFEFVRGKIIEVTNNPKLYNSLLEKSRESFKENTKSYLSYDDFFNRLKNELSIKRLLGK